MNKPIWIALTAASVIVFLQPVTMAFTAPPTGPVITELTVEELPTLTAQENPIAPASNPFSESPLAPLPVVTFAPQAKQKMQMAAAAIGSQFQKSLAGSESTAISPLDIPEYFPEPSRVLGGSKETRQPPKAEALGPLDSPESVEVLPTTPATDGTVLQTQSGMASWYGYEAGNMTASGERYNSQDLTAAHRTLSFNSRVRVTNTRTGKSVVVRINDRGPFIRGRIIDLSEAAAAAVGIKSSGVGNVQLDVLSYGSKGRKRR
jgi:rare lipoprotein A (peptidoglycan hydrolase)